MSIQKKFERVDLRHLVESVEEAIRHKRGYSVIRLGDGEGLVFCYDEPEAYDDLQRSIEIWFGAQQLSSAELSEIQQSLCSSIRSADIIGIPRPSQTDRALGYKLVFDGLEKYTPEIKPVFADAALHFYLQWSGALARILGGIDALGIISCRDLGPQIEQTFQIKSVRTYQVRGEYQFPGIVLQNHWPDGFRDVMRQVDDIEAGMVFLVAAGVLGKIYCDKIKSRGGIAIDIGSIIDGWDDIQSRPRISRERQSRLDHFVGIDLSHEANKSRLSEIISQTDIRDGTF